ncbi:MAG: hypothetical protein JRN35_05565 [Nitrososphaerota archaeon]|nr:hypothetical protein [Nitrososphaerota archaeon]
MELTATRADESVLIFGNGGRHVDPKAGLALFGPSGHAKGGGTPKSISVGIVGPEDATEAARTWLESLNSPVDNDKDNPRLYPTFPGIPVAFGATLECSENLIHNIPPKRLALALDQEHKRAVNSCAALFTEGLEILKAKAGRPNVVVYAWSDPIINKCVGGSASDSLPPAERRFRHQLISQVTAGQTRFFPLDDDAEQLLQSGKSGWNLHAQCKVEAMDHSRRLPIQILMPRTYGGESQRSDPGTPWNISTALFYKAGGIPWRPADPEASTCYVGIEFFRDKTARDKRMRTCVAQVFSDEGEGLVLRGSQFEHTGSLRRTPRMNEKVAETLVSDAVEMFRKHHHGQAPVRVVVHKSSYWVKEERRGANAALEEVETHDLVSIQKHRTIQFLRHGTQPPVRGTLVTLNTSQFSLYTHGYVPYLSAYPGMRVPRPLLVTRNEGSTGPMKLASEMMKLTKLNWNAARFSSQMPCTLAYADIVKEVLSQVPPDMEDISEDYSSYM